MRSRAVAVVATAILPVHRVRPIAAVRRQIIVDT